jgi:large subunit ribosomal protein L25
MEKVKLQAQVRDTSSKSELKKLRKTGHAPATVYGHGYDSLSISVDVADLAAAVKTEAGLYALMDLAVDGGTKKDSGVVVIKRIQKDPVTRKVVHVDFQRVRMSEKLTTGVPIRFAGTAAGAIYGGLVEHLIDSIQVRCLPDQIPTHIDVDISELGVGQALYIKDLPLPEGVEPIASPDEIVIAVRQPHVVTAAEAEAEAPAETPGVAAEESAAE